MRFLQMSFVFAIVTCAAAIAAAHDDVAPYYVDGKLATGGHDDILASDTLAERVFGYDFGETPSNPYVISDPGFNNGAFGIGFFPNDGLLPAGHTLSLEVVANLEYWDGSGGVSFSSAPADVTLGLNNPVAAETVLIGGAGFSGTEPTIGPVPDLGSGFGRVHVHLLSQLNFTDGTNPAVPNAPDGVYLVGLRLTLPGSDLLPSDPFYTVYNNNVDEEIHDQAIAWVNASLVPEPSTWLLAAGGGCLVAAAGWRRRRSRRARA